MPGEYDFTEEKLIEAFGILPLESTASHARQDDKRRYQDYQTHLALTLKPVGLRVPLFR